MLSLSFLIILLHSWFLWDCLFNPTSAQLGLLSVYPLGLFSLMNYVAPLDVIKILGIPFGSIFFAFSFL
jgi:hypothetical protein